MDANIDQGKNNPLNVLIVDGGETRVRINGSSHTSSNGYCFCEASTQTSAMFRLGTAMPDVVILDVTMDGHEGYATLEHVREVSSVPVIALSGDEDAESRIECLQLGADYCLSKNVAPRELLARARALSRRDKRSVSPSGLGGFAAA